MSSQKTADDYRERDGAFDQVVDRHLRPVLGGVLRQVRLEAGYTQIQLAEATRVPQTTISKIERAHRDITLLEFLAICEVLGNSPDKTIARLFNEIDSRQMQRPGRI